MVKVRLSEERLVWMNNVKTKDFGGLEVGLVLS